MYCPSCGVALSRQMKYCNFCGAQLIPRKESALLKSSEDRLREEMVDLFWVTLIGLSLILGGMALMKEVLQLSEWIIIVYLGLSVAAFIINIGISLWQIRRLARICGAGGRKETRQLETNELTEGKAEKGIRSVVSVTENTTRRPQTETEGELTR